MTKTNQYKGPERVYTVGLSDVEIGSVVTATQAINLSLTHLSAAEDLFECLEFRPACVISELALPGMSGLQLLRKMKSAALPACPIIFTKLATVESAVTAMKLGAHMLMQAPADPQTFQSNIVEAVGQSIIRWRQSVERIDIDRKLRLLNESERHVLDCVANGMSNRQIAGRLDLGLRTVELRRHTMSKKLKLDSTVDIVRFALQAAEQTR